MLTGKAALIINEMQIGVVDPAHAGFPQLAQQVVERGIEARIAALATAFRAAGLPIFHAPVIHRPDLAGLKANSLINALSLKKPGMTKGSPESAYCPLLTPADSDFEIVRESGLIVLCATQLDAILRRLDVSTIVLTGVSTNLAIPGNAIVGSELGYHMVIPEDCIAGADPQTHKTIVEQQLRMIARIVTADDVVAALQED